METEKIISPGNRDDEKLEWALQQFALNLAILSLHLDWPKFAEKGQIKK
jgi:hypothetical protein